MTTELWILLWAVVLGAVHITLAAVSMTAELGPKYNASPRDENLQVKGKVAGRLARAQRNFFETFPLFAAAILAAAIAGETGGHAALGGWIYLAARIVYIPLYALGIPVIRSIVWTIGVVGIALVWLAAAGVLA